MRRRHSSVLARRLATACALGALVALPLLPRPVGAQGGLSNEGALFLLVPVGARSVGMGQAVVASDIGSEGIWWNPASLAKLDRVEAAINHGQTIVATADALDLIYPAGRAGVFAASAYLFDYGQQEHTDQYGTLGTLYPRSIVLAASYAATFGSRASAGVTYKVVQQRLDCSGACGDVQTFNVSTGGIDLGVQVVPDKARRWSIGIALRNAGLRLQVVDNPQADPLPARVHIGAQYTVPDLERSVPGGELRLSTELVDRPSFGNPAFHLGGEFGYRKQVFLRAGVGTGSGDASGAAVGLGVQRGGIAMDFARSFGGFSSDAGKPPTYVTLRFRF